MTTAISATDSQLDLADRLQCRLDRVEAIMARRGSSRRVARGDQELQLINGKRTFVLAAVPTRDYALVRLQSSLKRRLAVANVQLLAASAEELRASEQQIAA